MKPQSHLQYLIQTIGSIGADDKGAITRLPFSDTYHQCASVTASLMEEAGLTVTTDSVGNVHGILSGTDPDAGTILLGSHLDTVKNGGLFDGTLGVAAAIECICRLRDAGIRPRHTLEVTGFQGEEGSSLGGTFGSRAMMGLLNCDDPSFAQTLSGYEVTASQVSAAAVDTSHYRCYLELHIEQGLRLELAGDDVGIVTGIVGITRFHITAMGESNHAGTTPMLLRKDSLTGAALLILYISQLASSYSNGLVATVGQIQVLPGAVAVIPGRTDLVLEVRHMDQTVINQFLEQVQQYAETIPLIHFIFEPMVEKHSVSCNEQLRSTMIDCCTQSGLKWQSIASGAGHDGNALGMKMPVGMIFVPSKGGISHSPLEWTDWEQCEKGAALLYETLLALDQDSKKEDIIS